MNNIETQKCIFIASAGRTGTQFFGNMMSQMIENCCSIHEADVLWITRPWSALKKIKNMGLFRMTIGKFMQKYSLRVLGVDRIRGRIQDEKAIRLLKANRKKLIETTECDVFLEANGQFSCLIDILPKAFPNSKVIFIIRDPRDWVRSWMNIPNSLYSSIDFRNWLLNARLNPNHYIDDPYKNQWKKMDQFEKLCWYWARENKFVLELSKKSNQIKTVRFEDLFKISTRDQSFEELLDFICKFPDGSQIKYNYLPDLHSKKVNSMVSTSFPDWRKWDSGRALILQNQCEEIMKEFDYGLEPEWEALLKRK